MVFVDYRNWKKTLDKLTEQPGKLIPLDRGGVPDLSVSGDKSDLVVVDPPDPTTTSKPEAVTTRPRKIPYYRLNQSTLVIKR
jgi:hypothetical protein